MPFLDRPVMVTGTPRSGKSLLARILGESPEFAFLSEPLTIWNIGLGQRPDDRRTADEVTERVRKRIRKACQARVAREGGERYLDDLAYHAVRIPFVHRVMPEAKIIHVIRSGEDALPELLYGWTYRDTVARAFARRRRNINFSTLPRLAVKFARNYVLSRFRGRRATWGPRVPGLEELGDSAPTAAVAALQWRRMEEIALRDLQKLPAEQVLEVRFEDVIDDPEGQAIRAGEFCEVDDLEALSEVAAEVVDPEFVGENRVLPTPREWEAVRPIIDPLQQRLGYGTAPSQE